MNSSCSATRGTSGVAGCPRSVAPEVAAWMFAGRTATRNTISAAAAARRVLGRSSPTAPRISQMPVKATIMSGAGTQGGTMRTRSARIGPKCATAVKQNMAASPTRVAAAQSRSAATPSRPARRANSVARIRTTRGAMAQALVGPASTASWSRYGFDDLGIHPKCHQGRQQLLGLRRARRQRAGGADAKDVLPAATSEPAQRHLELILGTIREEPAIARLAHLGRHQGFAQVRTGGRGSLEQRPLGQPGQRVGQGRPEGGVTGAAAAEDEEERLGDVEASVVRLAGDDEDLRLAGYELRPRLRRAGPTGEGRQCDDRAEHLGGARRAAEPGGAAGPRLRGLDVAIARRRRGDQGVEQLVSHRGGLVDRALEGRLVRLRRLVEAGELAHELERRGPDLVIGDRRIEVEERLDVAAHGTVSLATIHSLLGPFHRDDSLPLRGIRDEPVETPHPGRLLLGTHHPQAHRPLIPGRLGAKERARSRHGLELLLVPGGELGRPLLVGIATRPFLIAVLEDAPAGGPHPPCLLELRDAPDIDEAPVASGPARREADRVAVLVQALADAVDPADAEGLVHGLRPGDAGLARSPLVVPDPQLLRGRGVLFEPAPKIGRGLEESHAAGAHSLPFTERATAASAPP